MEDEEEQQSWSNLDEEESASDWQAKASATAGESEADSQIEPSAQEYEDETCCEEGYAAGYGYEQTAQDWDGDSEADPTGFWEGESVAASESDAGYEEPYQADGYSADVCYEQEDDPGQDVYGQSERTSWSEPSASQSSESGDTFDTVSSEETTAYEADSASESEPHEEGSWWDRLVDSGESAISDLAHGAADVVSDIPVLGDIAETAADGVEQIAQFDGGILKGAGTFVGGVVNMVEHPLQTAQGLEAMAEHIPGTGDLLRTAHAGIAAAIDGEDVLGAVTEAANPIQSLQDDLSFWGQVGGKILDPYAQEIDQGKYAEAAGRAVFDIGGIVLSAGGGAAAEGAVDAGRLAVGAGEAAEAAATAGRTAEGVEAAATAARTVEGGEAAATAARTAEGVEDAAQASKATEGTGSSAGAAQAAEGSEAAEETAQAAAGGGGSGGKGPGGPGGDGPGGGGGGEPGEPGGGESGRSGGEGPEGSGGDGPDGPENPGGEGDGSTPKEEPEKPDVGTKGSRRNPDGTRKPPDDQLDQIRDKAVRDQRARRQADLEGSDEAEGAGTPDLDKMGKSRQILREKLKPHNYDPDDWE